MPQIGRQCIVVGLAFVGVEIHAVDGRIKSNTFGGAENVGVELQAEMASHAPW